MELIDPVAVVCHFGGVCDGTTLRALSDHWQIRLAVRDGRLLRLTRNRYVLPGARQAEVAAARLHGVISHLSAAQYWGWKIRREPELPVVSLPRGRKVGAGRGDGVDVRWQQLPPAQVHRGIVTSRARTVLDCARSLPLPDALSVADSALREGRVSRDQLVAELEQGPRSGRVRARQVIDVADVRADNPFESCLRAHALSVAGLNVEPQFLIEYVGKVDLVDPVLRTAFEADSFGFHSDKGMFRHDIRRYTAIVRAGWTLVRFCWEDVMFQPKYVTDVMADLVARGPDLRPVRVTSYDRRL